MKPQQRATLQTWGTPFAVVNLFSFFLIECLPSYIFIRIFIYNGEIN